MFLIIYLKNNDLFVAVKTQMWKVRCHFVWHTICISKDNKGLSI